MPSWSSNLTARGTKPGPGGVALADIPERVIAFIIDAIIVGVVGLVLSVILGSVLRETRTDTFLGVPIVVTGPSLIGQLVAVVLVVGFSAGYFIYMWSRMGGATVGMRLMKLSVRDESTGQVIGQQQAINRWLVAGLPFALYSIYYLPIALIGFLAAIAVLVYEIYLLVTTAQSPTRQGWHDKFAKTVVAKG
jgi:uncharacterized RDD family membrane protein YckC